MPAAATLGPATPGRLASLRVENRWAPVSSHQVMPEAAGVFSAVSARITVWSDESACRLRCVRAALDEEGREPLPHVCPTFKFPKKS